MKHFKLILKTLFSNNACVEAARTREPKYTIVAIVFVIFALFFAGLPTCVTGFQKQGGSWIPATNYSFDVGMLDFGNNVKDKGITLEIKEDSEKKHSLVATNWDNIGTYNEAHSDLHCLVSMNKDNTTKILEVYYCDKDNEQDFVQYVTDVANNIDPTKDHNLDTQENWLETTTNSEGTAIKKNRLTSFIVFGKYNVQGAIYAPSNATALSGIFGDYNNTPVTESGANFIDYIYTKNNNTETLNKCRTFFNETYINNRWTSTWRSTGVILGVDAGVILLMGFMVWILTRGRNNPFRIYSFWDAQKIAYYACLTPGILSLFGFLLSNMAMMLFILGVGIRVMWLSMRTLRYQAPAKQ